MEMQDSKINLTQVTIVIILVIGSLAAYYLNVQSEKNKILRQEIELKRELEEKKLQQQKELEEERISVEQTKEDNKNALVSVCESDAFSNYTADWDGSCKTLSKSRESDIKNCLIFFQKGNALNELSVEICKQRYPVRSEKDCSLPKAIADELNQRLQKNKENCYKKYN